MYQLIVQDGVKRFEGVVVYLFDADKKNIRFGDYWRMGLPLEGLVLAVALPAILWFWPL